MVNVSKRVLPKSVTEELYAQLADVFFASDTRKDSVQILTEVLTNTERILLAKRVGIIAMLTYGYSSYKIMHTLNVSTFTIASVQQRLDRGAYRYVTDILRRRKAREGIFKIIEDAVIAISPARANQTLKKQIVRGASKTRAGSR